MQLNPLDKFSQSIEAFSALVVDLFPDVDFNLPTDDLLIDCACSM